MNNNNNNEIIYTVVFTRNKILLTFKNFLPVTSLIYTFDQGN